VGNFSFVFVIKIDGGGTELNFGGNLPDRRSLIAILHEQLFGCVEDELFEVFLVFAFTFLYTHLNYILVFAFTFLYTHLNYINGANIINGVNKSKFKSKNSKTGRGVNSEWSIVNREWKQ